MGQYAYTLICGSVFTAVIIALSPGGERSKTGKYVAFIGALAMAAAMLSPLPSFLSENDFFSETENSAVPETYESSDSAEYYANSAGMALSEIYGTDISRLQAEVTCDDGGNIKKITLFISDTVYYSTEEAGETLSEIYGMEIEVLENE